MKEVYRYDSAGFYVEPVLLNDWDEIPEDCTDIPLPQPNWKPKFVNGEWIEWEDIEVHKNEARAEKLGELNSECSRRILGRFTATINGVQYQFSNDTQAQANFDKMLLAFERGYLTELNWTAYDMEGNVVRVPINATTMQVLYVAHLTHIQNNIAKFRDILMPQVIEAETVEDIKNISWE